MKKFVSLLLSFILVIALALPVSASYPTYTSLGVPTGINTSFKAWMPASAVTMKSSPQYKLIHSQWTQYDTNGFLRCNAERDLGITDDYYYIALGSYYGTKIGAKYRITTDTGNVFYGILSDCKADRHTNSTHQYSSNNNVVEFIINKSTLNSKVRAAGSANVLPHLNGNITKIERINF